MLYQKTLTVPANTPSDAPVETTIVVKDPVIVRLGVFFPPGCAGMVKVAVFYGRLQIWPSKEGEWLRGDGTTIWGEPFFELPEKETTLTLKGCSPNTLYNHDVTFYIIALPRHVALWMIGISRLVAALETFLAELVGISIPSK